MSILPPRLLNEIAKSRAAAYDGRRLIIAIVVAFLLGFWTGCSGDDVDQGEPDAMCYQAPNFDVCDFTVDPKVRTRWQEQLGDQCVLICCLGVQGEICGTGGNQ